MSRSAISNAPSESLIAPQRPLRRLTLELFGIIALKIVALALIWWVVFAPQSKPDVSPAAISQLLAPTPQTPTEAHP